MGISHQAEIEELRSLMEDVDETLRSTFQTMHQGYPLETLRRFLKARDWNVDKAHKMLIDCLQWRVQTEIDSILSKQIIPSDVYRAVRESHLVGLSGFSKEGLPVIAVGVGLSTFDKASVDDYVQSHIQLNEYRDRVVLSSASKKYGRPIHTCLKVLDMTGLRFSALSQVKLLTVMSTIDDLNYPEKTGTYYVVNAPLVFSACWKVVKPLLQERTRRKIQVLQGCGREELLKVMDYSSLPHFCRKEGSGSSRYGGSRTTDNCFSADHAFHQQFYSYLKQQAFGSQMKQRSVHVTCPEEDPEDAGITKAVEHKLKRFIDGGFRKSMNVLQVNGN